MVDIANDIQSLSSFKRETTKVARKLKRTGKPVVLTVNGKAEMVVQDAAAYQRLLDLAAQAEKAEMIAFLRESKADADAGRTKPAREAVAALRRKQKPGERG